MEVLLPPRGQGVEWWMGSGATMAWQEQGMHPWHMAPSLHQQSIGCALRGMHEAFATPQWGKLVGSSLPFLSFHLLGGGRWP